MKHRLLVFGLAMAVLGNWPTAAQAQCGCDPCQKSGLQRLLPDRFAVFGSDGDCKSGPAEVRIVCNQKPGCEQKSMAVQKSISPRIQKAPTVQKAAACQKPLVLRGPTVVQKSLAVQKPLVVQRSIVVQKPMVQKPMVQKPMVQKPMVQKPMVQKPMVQKPDGCCEPCGCYRPGGLRGFVERLDTALMRIFPPPACCCAEVVAENACGCGGEPSGHVPLLPVPGTMKDHRTLDENPFRDDTLPIPMPPAPDMEARVPSVSSAIHVVIVEDNSSQIRPAAFYAAPVQTEPAAR